MTLTEAQREEIAKHLHAALDLLEAKPAPEPEPDRRDGPTFGIDISSHNSSLDLAAAYKEGYRFCWVKCTEGPYRDGTSYVNPYYKQQVARAKELGMVVGAYLFLVETPARPQVDLFLKHAGGLGGMGVAVDFEKYYPDQYSYLTPSNETLENTVAALRSRVKGPITIYSSESFWSGNQSGTVPSGKWSTYGADVAWVAHWRNLGPEAKPKGYFSVIEDQYNPLKDTLGGKRADLGQFCIGRVAGQNIDANVFPGTVEEYRKLTVGSGVTPQEWNPVTGKLAPPGFVPKAPQPNASRYDQRYPTRFQFREDVEQVVRNLYKEFGKYNIFVNTYVKHPPVEPRPTVSFDVWGGGGDRPGHRGLPLNPKIGAEVFDFLFNDPNPPNLRWCIYRRQIRGAWNNFVPEPFGDGTPFTNHDDHSHWTYDGPFQQIK